MSAESENLINAFSSLPHQVYRDAVDEIARGLNLHDTEKYETVCSAGSEIGENYFGTMFRIQIRCKSDNSIKLSLIVKLPPLNDAKREEFLTSFAFEREILFYDAILPQFVQFQRERNAELEGFHEVSLCYKTLGTEPHTGIFLDDLKMKGFEMFDRKKDVSIEHVYLIMKTIAKMHATFFCMKDQCPDAVEEFCNIEDFLLHHLRIGKPLYSSCYENTRKEAFEVLETCENEDLKRKVKDYLNASLLELLQSTIGNDVSKYSTLCHGDCWNNNMMFKNDENNIPVDIRIYDFQILRYAPPVTDIFYYLFTSVTKELRNKHYHEIMDVYYSSLAGQIKRLGSEPEKLYPRQVFDDQLKKFAGFGLFMSVITVPAMTTDVIIDIDSICEQLKTGTVEAFDRKSEPLNKNYVQRMKGIFEDIYEWGFI